LTIEPSIIEPSLESDIEPDIVEPDIVEPNIVEPGVKPNIEVGYGLSHHDEAFAAGTQAASQALGFLKMLGPSVALVFASAKYDLPELLRGVADVLGNVPTIGATTAGEICGEIHHESVVVTVLASPYLTVRYGIGQRVSQGWENALDEALNSVALQTYFKGDPIFWSDLTRSGTAVFAMMFSPGETKHASSPGYEILEALKIRSLGRFPIVGGAAADDWKMETNCVFAGEEVFPDSVLIAIFETKLQFGIALSHGFQAEPIEVTVTAAEGKEILTLDNRPAADAYAELMGYTRQSLEGKNMALTTGIVVGTYSPIGGYSVNIASYMTPAGGMRMNFPVAVGTKLTLMKAKTESMNAATSEALRRSMLRGSITNPAVSLVWYCALRPEMACSNSQEELSIAARMLCGRPLLGFCSFGEQGLADDGTCRHNTASVSVLVIGEELSQTALVAKENDELHSKLEQKVLERTAELDAVNQLLKESLWEMINSQKHNHHLNQVLKAIRNVNQLIVREHDPGVLLSEACDILVHTRGYRLAWIGKINEDLNCIMPVARAGQCVDYLDKVRVPWKDGESVLGPTGMALKTGKPACCRSIASDPSFAPWREAAQSQGLESILSVPMTFGNRAFGVLTVYSDNLQAFDDEEISLMEEVAGDLAFALQSLENEAKRRKAEVALWREEKFNRALLENMVDGVVACDADGLLTLFNRTAREWHGLDCMRAPPEEWARIYSIYLEDGVTPMSAASVPLWRAFQGETVHEAGMVIRAKGQEPRQITVNCTPFFDEFGRELGAVAVMHDITERKAMEVVLEESEAKYRRLFENSPVGIISVDLNGNITEVNDALVNVMGSPSAEATKQINAFEFDPLKGAGFSAAFSRCVESGEPIIHEHPYISRWGKSLHLNLRLNPVRDARGAVTGAQGTVEDISKQKLAEEKLTASLHEKEVMLKEIHHRVKNNLQVVSSILNIQAGYTQDKQIISVFSESQNRIRSMAFVHEMLYGSEDLAQIGLNDYIQKMADYLNKFYDASKKISIAMDLEEVTLGVDKAIPFGLILNELLTNCIKHAFPDAKGGKIRIDLRLEKGDVVFILCDNGVGLPLDLDIKAVKSLGLTLVCSLVKQLKGTIDIHSDGGAQFKITFPDC
jgi:PAS domain S-box-containing protein